MVMPSSNALRLRSGVRYPARSLDQRRRSEAAAGCGNVIFIRLPCIPQNGAQESSANRTATVLFSRRGKTLLPQKTDQIFWCDTAHLFFPVATAKGHIFVFPTDFDLGTVSLDL